jgi:hypothetical protein
MESSLSLKNRLAGLRKDLQARLDTLNKRLESSHFENERANIEKDIESLSGAYSKAFERVESAIRVAEGVEQAKEAEKEAKRLSVEMEVKSRASKEWEKAGGDPNQFEASWSTIRQAILNEQVISSLTNSEQESKPTSKAFTL